jgi:hypothetical protein
MTKQRVSLVRAMTAQAMAAIEAMLRDPDGTLTDAERMEFANTWRTMQGTLERLNNKLSDMRANERLQAKRLAAKRIA